MTQNIYLALGITKSKMINLFGISLRLAPAKCVVVPSGSRRWQR